MRAAIAVVAASLSAHLPHVVHHPARCSSRECEHRVAHRQARQRKRRIIAPYRAWLTRVARCESGGRWHLATGNGFYGGLQFTLGTWRSVGGRGQPHQASRLEQEYRGVLVLRSQGPRAWPVCGR